MIDAYIYDTLRTPLGRGTENGALFEVRPIDLVSKCLKALVQRNQLDTSLVEDIILGCVVPIGGQADNIAKTASLQAGWANTVSGMQINRFQASGLASVGLAAAKIKAGWASLIVAGGLESCSRIHRADNRGAISSDPDVINRIGSIPVGVAADLLATLEGFAKEQLDEYAFRSVQKAKMALEKGYFKKSVLPIFDQNKIPILEQDQTLEEIPNEEHIASSPTLFPKSSRGGFTAIALRKYPLLERVIPMHSEGNTAPSADGAALVLVGDAAKGKALNLKARAKIIGLSTQSSELTITHKGGIRATQDVLKQTNLKPKDMDLWYVNESFAAPALLFQQTFKIPNKSLNPCGGNIAFGDALGANGSILLGTLLDELERQDLKRGLIALSAEGGIGMSMIIERI